MPTLSALSARQATKSSQAAVAVAVVTLAAGSRSASKSSAGTVSLRAQLAGTGARSASKAYTRFLPQSPTHAIEKLLARVHSAVFDKSEGQALAMTVAMPGGWEWRISGGQAEVWAGQKGRLLELSGYTVAELGQELSALGAAVSVSSAFAGRSALVLAPSQGSAGNGIAAPLYAYTSLLWVILDSYDAALADVRPQLFQALRQMVITSAEAEWLDLWGALYAVPRQPGDGDAQYAPKIPQEAFRRRQHPVSIERAVLDNTGKVVRIEEPWKEIFTLDQSALSGPDKFYDGSHIGYHLIRVVTSDNVTDWDGVIRVVNRNRAAGVLVSDIWAKRVSECALVPTPAVDGITRSGGLASEAAYVDRMLLDNSDIEDVPLPNHPTIYRFQQKTVSYCDLATTGRHWDDSTWQDGSGTWTTVEVVAETLYRPIGPRTYDGSFTYNGAHDYSGFDPLP